MFGFAEILNIQNYVNWRTNSVHYICTECLDLQKNWRSRTPKIQREIIYIIYIQNFWICRKIECPELRKFNRKLCTLYVQNVWICRKTECPNYGKSTRNCVHYTYGMSGFVEKLNLQNCENSTANCVHHMYEMSGFADKLTT